MSSLILANKFTGLPVLLNLTALNAGNLSPAMTQPFKIYL